MQAKMTCIGRFLLKPELLEEGFKPISWEKKVEPGFVDIYGEDKNGKLVIVEVKRKTASKEAALQLAKYIEPIKAKVNREVRGGAGCAKSWQGCAEAAGYDGVGV